MTKRATQLKRTRPGAAGTPRVSRATKATARKVARFALAKKAEDVLLMDLRKVTDVTSFFVVCEGASSTQVKAIADNVIEQCKKSSIEIYNVEGYESLRWVLIDLIDMVVHVFQPDVRAYYQLERLWGDAPTTRIGEDGMEAAS